MTHRARPVDVPAYSPSRRDRELLGVPSEARDRDLFEANGFFFRPIQESIRDLEAHLDPRDARVATVAAYGGYPSFFLAGGAERVIGFDVDPRQIGWNLIIREGLRNLDYESGRRYLLHDADLPEMLELHQAIFETMPPEHQASAESIAAIFELGMSDEAVREMGYLYPHIRDRRTWDAARGRVQDGAWDIRRIELLELLEGLAQEDDELDILYISSIRNWFLHYRLDEDPHRAAKFDQYDGRLAEHARRLLRQGGRIYEVIINDGSRFPRIPIDPEDYPGFDVSRHASCDGLSTEVIVAEKR